MMSATTTITRQVIVPEQTPSPVKSARETARSLGGILATFDEAAADVGALAKAKEGKYLLAVDSTGMPKEEGWHLVIRENGKITFKSIKEKEADKIISKGRYDEVLYVNESALKAAKEERPVALDFVNGGRRYLGAVDWAGCGARVALSSQASEASAPQITSILRVENKDQTVVLTSPNGDETRIKVKSGTTVRIEQEN